MVDSIVISIQRLLRWNEAIKASDTNEVSEALDMIVLYDDAISHCLIKGYLYMAF